LNAVVTARRIRHPGRAAVAYAAYFVSIGVWFPYLPVYYHALGLDLATIGLFAAVSAATSLVAGPAWGIVADTLDRSGRALPLAALLAATAALGLWLAGGLLATIPGAPDPRALLLMLGAAVCVAASSAGVGPQLDARAVDSVGGDRVGYGRLRAWGSLSFIVTAAVAGRLLDATGPAGLFAVFVPALVATAVVTATLPGIHAPEVDGPRPRAPLRASPLGPGLGELVRVPELRAFLLAMFVCWSALNAANAFLSVDLVTLGAPPNVVGLAWAVGAALEVPLMWLYPTLAARFGADRLLVAGPIALGIRALGCALAPTPEVLVAVTALQGVGFALSFVGGVAHVARLAPRRLGATAQGLFGSATVGLGAIAGSGIGGLIVDSVGLRGVFTLSAAASLVAAGLVVRSLRIGRRGARYDAGMRTLSEAG
jgi:MFS transporter, PPP family, 3-phenylpropionic acid transporter